MRYDFFLSYNSEDHAAAKVLARHLRTKGLTVFLDRWYLAPGLPWPRHLEQLLKTCRAAIILVGPHGMGRWQLREQDLALDRQTREPSFKVVPVLLPNADPPLGFLSLNTWVDMRQEVENSQAIERLAALLDQAPLQAEALSPIMTDIRASICPYRGLQPFREEDAAFFYGRAAFIERIVNTWKSSNLLAIVGASGSGKSSVAFAGLVPVLRHENTHQVWEIATMVPGDRPLHTLSAALLQLLEPELPEVRRLAETVDLARHLATRQVTLRDAVDRILAKQPGTDRLALIVDQWEEVYTLAGRPDRERFISEILEATAKGSLSVLLTLRGEFYGQLLEHRALVDRLETNVINLGPMTQAELRSAIENPALQLGVEFEAGLIERILADAGREPGYLPFLELVLSEIWANRRGKQLVHAAYEATGGVSGVLARRAEEIYSGLTHPEDARILFLQLIQLGDGTPDTRRRSPLSVLRRIDESVVRELVNARLLVASRDLALGEETIEIAHEALIDSWARLRDWLARDREFLLWRQRFQASLREWERHGRENSFLLRGGPLAEAEEWLSRRHADLRSIEEEFIHESMMSRSREQRERQRLRHRMVAGLAAGLILAVLFAIVSLWGLLQAEHERRIAFSKQLAAQSQNLTDAQIDLALLLAIEAYRFDPTVESERALLNALHRSPHLSTFISHDLDGWPRLVSARHGEVLVVSRGKGLVSLWNSATRHWGADLQLPNGEAVSLSFDPVHNWIAVGGRNEIKVWDLSAQEPRAIATMKQQGLIVGLSFNPVGELLATSNSDGVVMLWNTRSWRPVGAPWHVEATIGRSSISLGDKWLLACDDNDEMSLFDITTRSPVAGRSGLRCLNAGFGPSGMLVGEERNSSSLVIWSPASITTGTLPIFQRSSALCGAFSPDGKRFAAGMIDASVVVWDLEKGEEIAKLVGHAGPVWSVTFRGDGQTLASRDNEGNLIIWDLGSPSALASRVLNLAKSVRSLAFSHDSLKLAIGSRDQGVILWDLASRTRAPERFFTGQVEDVAFSPNKPLLAASMEDAVGLWNFERHRIEGRFYQKPYMPGRLEFFPDGKMLAVGSSGVSLEPGAPPFPVLNGGIMLFETNTSRLIRLLTMESHGVSGLRVKGRTLIAGGASSIKGFPNSPPMGRVFLWDVDSGKAIASKMILSQQINDIAISNDGRLLATATENSIDLWRLQDQSALGSLRGEEKDFISSIEFSPDGTMLASGEGFDGHVTLWDVRTHQVIGKLPGHSDYVSRVTWNGNGKILASAANDGSVILWDMEPESWIRRACGMVDRNLTEGEWALYLGNERYRETCGPQEQIPSV